MKVNHNIKHLIFLLLTFLLGAQTTYAKTELVLTQNQVSFSIEQIHSFYSLEKEVQPNIYFLKEEDTSTSIYLAETTIPCSSATSFKLLKSAYNSGQKQLVKLSGNNIYELVAHAPDIHNTRYIYKVHNEIPDDQVQLLSQAIKNGDAPESKLNELFSFSGNKSEQLRVIGEVVGEAGTSLFSKGTIDGINGFSDNIATVLSQRGLTITDFKLLQQKRYDLMTLAERAHIDVIRNTIPMPDGNTLLQKVIPKNQILKYTSGEYTQIGGFVSTAKDAKHLNTFEDIYHGMRLDYPGTQFNLADGSCGVIRYKTPNPNLDVPKLKGTPDDPPLPFTGNGFTGGNNGRLGTPEWKSPFNTPNEGAELWEVFSDGKEILRAKFSTSQNKFIAVP